MSEREGASTTLMDAFLEEFPELRSNITELNNRERLQVDGFFMLIDNSGNVGWTNSHRLSETGQGKYIPAGHVKETGQMRDVRHKIQSTTAYNTIFPGEFKD